MWNHVRENVISKSIFLYVYFSVVFNMAASSCFMSLCPKSFWPYDELKSLKLGKIIIFSPKMFLGIHDQWDKHRTSVKTHWEKVRSLHLLFVWAYKTCSYQDLGMMPILISKFMFSLSKESTSILISSQNNLTNTFWNTFHNSRVTL